MSGMLLQVSMVMHGMLLQVSMVMHGEYGMME